MLNDRDRRILDAMERQLAADDPRTASLGHRVHRSELWLRRGIEAALVVAAVSAALCFAVPTRTTVGAGAVATALFAILAVAYVRRVPRWRTRTRRLLRHARSRLRTPRGRATSP